MVVGLYLGGVATTQGLLTRVSSTSRTAFVCYAHHGFTRGYAAHAHVSPHRKEPAPNHPGRKNASAKLPSHLKQKNEVKKPHTKPSEEFTAAQVEEIERVMAFQHLMPTIDPWGQAVQDTLDVMLPRPITLELAKSPRQCIRTVLLNAQNRLKSYFALNMMRVANAPATKDTSRLAWADKMRAWIGSKRAPKLKKEAVLGPIKQVALETYMDVNTALASRNPKEISRFTTSKYQEQMLGLCKSSKAQNASGRMIWQLHRVLSPVSIVSLRVTEGYMAREAPRFGNRLMVHALIKFDTEQSLEMYDFKGHALHKPATETELQPGWDVDASTEAWRVPAQRRRVTEYLVMEKRMWIQSPWQFREQMW